MAHRIQFFEKWVATNPRIESLAHVFQLAEKEVLKTLQCGFESHRGHMSKLFRLTGWTIYWDDRVMTFRHRCGWEIYSDELMPQGMLIEGIVEHVC